jgi:hypothetical protein
MARIPTVSVESAAGPASEIFHHAREQYGYVPGVLQVMLVDPDVAVPIGALYQHLNLRPDSPFTRLQREMLATVVNGLVGGAP